MKIIRPIIIAALVVVATAIVFAFWYPAGDPAERPVPTDGRTGSISLSIQGMSASERLEVSNVTLLQILTALNEQRPSMQLSTKTYTGIGTLVDGMYGMHNGEDNKYWQYTVNGVMPQIGADAYIPQPGDSIEWYFAESAL